jgi:DNA-binding LacI/PurR family transcriptional regulator
MSTTYYTETYQSNIASPFSLAKSPMQAFSRPKNASPTYTTTIQQSEVEQEATRKLIETFHHRILIITIEILWCRM